MGVYKPAKSRFWHYDFTIQGERFHGSTGQETKRSALAYERRRRSEAAEGRLGDAAQMPLDMAADRWWIEKGSERGDAATVAKRLETLITIIGPDKKLCNIDGAVVSAAVEMRRRQTFARSDKPNAKRYPIKPATVNRDIIETLRPILQRAKKHWGARGLPEIDWGEYRLTEPAPVQRLYTDDQMLRWREEAHRSCEAASAALGLLLRYGMRYDELFFELDWFKPDTRELVMPGHARKRDVWNHIPLLEADARDLAARIGRARAAGLATAWFYEKGGRLVALTYGGLSERLERAARKAGLTENRLIHGARHHAGTSLLRSTKGNLALVKKLLGHENIQSTMRYAHALTDDLRDALEADHSRNGPGPRTDKAESA